jgi:Uma2 family endonuclease
MSETAPEIEPATATQAKQRVGPGSPKPTAPDRSQAPAPYKRDLSRTSGAPPPRGQPLSNAELMKLGDSDLRSWFPPPPLRGEPLSNAELMKLGDDDLMSERKPIVDSVEQRQTMERAGSMLRAWFTNREDVMVCVDLGLYYLPRDERGRLPCATGDQLTDTAYAPFVVPDVMVAFGVRRRRYGGSYQTWKEGKVPDFVLEVASTSTWKEDYSSKRDLYQRLGVVEYFVYDARERPRPERLVGHRLDAAGRYRKLHPTMHEGLGTGTRSELLGLVLFVDEAGELGLWDPVRKERRRHLEESEAALAESEAALAETEAALAAGREALRREREAREELERELAALRATAQRTPGSSKRKT